jgi:aspartyl-tRNA(Asn)/glutamyl-tRNA(Gln) amidotransferase subunit A
MTLHALSAHELLSAYRARTLSPVEVTQAVLDHIALWEPHIHASYLLNPQTALAQAKASEARWMKGLPCGPLDGVPITLKDNIATEGDPKPVGSAASRLTSEPADSPPAARAREAGAVLLCKTTMPDYGMLSSGLSSFHALARNPWNLRKTPGGSSAGAGAAGAAGYGPLHVGTDIGGSVRLPAGWCGLFGLKPSLGRIPIDPPYTGRAAGPMTRTVADSALLMQVMSLPDSRDSMSLPAQELAWDDFDVDVAHLRGLKIGLLLDAGCGLAVEPEVHAAIVQAAKLFTDAGAQVETMDPFLTRTMLTGMDMAWRMRSHVELSALPSAQRAKVLPYINAWADSAAGMTGRDTFEATSQFHATRVASVNACAKFDYVISPTAPIVAFDAELPSPTNDPLNGLEHIAFTVPFNMSEQPAASINCGYSRSGLPIGIQVAGQRFDDLGVLRVCRAFEKIRAPQRPWPTVPTMSER